jgi:predicted metalloprotease with PDZ domain
MATGNSYGGLEHCNSTSLITPRDDLPKANEPEEPSKDYQRFWVCVAMSISIHG